MTDTRPRPPDEIIDHGQVRLRRHGEDDLDAVFQAVTDSLDHLRPWMPWAADYTRPAAHEFLDASARRAGVPRKLGFTEAGRRPLDLPPLAGTGIGVVWQLAR